MENKKSKAIDTGSAFLSGADMSKREKEILEELSLETGFVPGKNISRSSYFNTKQIGASHWSGEFEGKPAVLKIQGVKPDISEIFMISEFNKQNQSKRVRPPILYKTFPWDKEKGYEALIMEYITGSKVLESKKLQDKEGILKFYEYYLEYRKNCLPRKPWLPYQTMNTKKDVEKAVSISEKAYKNHPFRKDSDRDLADRATRVLSRVYKGVKQEFIHGHFSFYDLLYEKPGSDKVVLFSNLFWKWRPPFFDAVFAYHWFMYELEHVEGITPSDVDKQRALWKETMFGLPLFSNRKNKLLLKAALLRLAGAGVLLDGFFMNKNRPIVKYLFDSVRGEARNLISDLESE